MDDVKIFATLGSLIVGLIALVGGIIARDRNISSRISDGNTKAHERIDELKDDMNNHFARKDDVRDAVQRLERSIEKYSEKNDSNHATIIQLLLDRDK